MGKSERKRGEVVRHHDAFAAETLLRLTPRHGSYHRELAQFAHFGTVEAFGIGWIATRNVRQHQALGFALLRERSGHSRRGMTALANDRLDVLHRTAAYFIKQKTAI